MHFVYELVTFMRLVLDGWNSFTLNPPTRPPNCYPSNSSHSQSHSSVQWLHRPMNTMLYWCFGGRSDLTIWTLVLDHFCVNSKFNKKKSKKFLYEMSLGFRAYTILNIKLPPKIKYIHTLHFAMPVPRLPACVLPAETCFCWCQSKHTVSCFK
jgi:hypothetical protein